MKKTNNNTELVFVLDRSGSMEHLTSETIGGFNSLIKKQKEENPNSEVFVTTVLFDDKIEILHDHENIKNVKRLTEKEYYARGCTALLDAVGYTIKTLSNRIKESSEDGSSKVLFVITTDGYENASRKYTKAKINKMISKKQEKDSWKFVFLGANIDAVSEADSIGIRSYAAASPSASSRGVSSSFNFLSKLTNYLCEADVNDIDYDTDFEMMCEKSIGDIE